MLNAINSIRVNSPVETEEQAAVVTQPSFRGDDYEKAPIQDEFVYADDVEEKKSNKGLIIGLATVAVLVGGFFMGRAGMLGNWMKKITGGLKKEAREALNSVKEKKLSELSAEEKEKVKKALNPDNDTDLAEKIEKKFSEKSESKLEEIVDVDGRKLKEEAAEAGKEVKKPEDAPKAEETPKEEKSFDDFAKQMGENKVLDLTDNEKKDFIEEMTKKYGFKAKEITENLMGNTPDLYKLEIDSILMSIQMEPKQAAWYKKDGVMFKKIKDLTPEELEETGMNRVKELKMKLDPEETLLHFSVRFTRTLGKECWQKLGL